MVGSMTSYLFARPSLFEGVGRILDFGGTLTMYNMSKTSDEADTKAAAADWQTVGEDLRVAMAEEKANVKP